MLKVVCVVDKVDTAIDRLAQGMAIYHTNLDYQVVDVHPKRPDAQQLQRFEEAAYDADILDWQYFKTAEMLRSRYDWLKDKKHILTHHNPYSITESDWNSYDIVVGNNRHIYSELGKITQKPVEYIGNTVDTNFWTYNTEWEPNHKVIMVANRIESKKGILPVAIACGDLNLRLVLVGSVSDRNYFHSILQTGVVQFYEQITDEKLRELYGDSTIHVCNSVDNFESGCYDDETEILTENGWKLFKDLDKSEDVATLNPITDSIEYQRPHKYVVQDGHKELYEVKNRAIEFSVTANHNMWVSTRTTGKDRSVEYKPYRFLRADELPQSFKIKRTANWQGERQKELNWYRFVGIYLAEGCVVKGSENSYRISIAAVKPKQRQDIQNLLNEMGFKYEVLKDQFRIGGQNELARYLLPLGKALDKYVPKEVLNADPDAINEFINWFVKGDGGIFNGARIIYTSSKKLADTMQEAFIKSGTHANISIRDRRGEKRWIKDHWVTVKNLEYVLHERVKKSESYVRKSIDLHKKEYSGKVYCVEVKNHILLVRKNGKPYFCGNTLPMLEAMLTGVPVLTRKIGHVPELYNGENMVLHEGDPEDVIAITNKLKDMLWDKKTLATMRDKAWNTAKNRSHERRAYLYQKLYRQVMFPEQTPVSIVVPIYDKPDVIRQCLNAIGNQDYKNIEVIAADDSGNCRQDVMDFASTVPFPVRYLDTHRDNDYGLARARNEATIEATGDIMVYCDQRMIMEPDAISEFVKYVKPKHWLYGNKGVKKEFVENFSCVYRQDAINAGIFCERMDCYGGMSQELRTRIRNQLIQTEYIESAKANPKGKSSNRNRKRQDIIRAKNRLWKMELE